MSIALATFQFLRNFFSYLSLLFLYNYSEFEWVSFSGTCFGFSFKLVERLEDTSGFFTNLFYAVQKNY